MARQRITERTKLASSEKAKPKVAADDKTMSVGDIGNEDREENQRDSMTYRTFEPSAENHEGQDLRRVHDEVSGSERRNEINMGIPDPASGTLITSAELQYKCQLASELATLTLGEEASSNMLLAQAQTFLQLDSASIESSIERFNRVAAIDGCAGTGGPLVKTETCETPAAEETAEEVASEDVVDEEEEDVLVGKLAAAVLASKNQPITRENVIEQAKKFAALDSETVKTMLSMATAGTSCAAEEEEVEVAADADAGVDLSAMDFEGSMEFAADDAEVDPELAGLFEDEPSKMASSQQAFNMMLSKIGVSQMSSNKVASAKNKSELDGLWTDAPELSL